jgi:hypothetical protein
MRHCFRVFSLTSPLPKSFYERAHDVTLPEKSAAGELEKALEIPAREIVKKLVRITARFQAVIVHVARALRTKAPRAPAATSRGAPLGLFRLRLFRFCFFLHSWG